MPLGSPGTSGVSDLRGAVAALCLHGLLESQIWDFPCLLACLEIIQHPFLSVGGGRVP